MARIEDEILRQADPFKKRQGRRRGKRENGNGDDRSPIDPGEGIAAPARPVRLTSTEQAQLAEEFSSEIETQYEAQSTLRNDMQRWLTVYRGKPLNEIKDYPLRHAPLARDTEVLTRQGWRRVDALSLNDHILTRRDDDARLEWHPVEATPRVWAEELYWFKSETIDQQVTAEHTMVCSIWYRSKLLRLTAKEAWNRTNLKVPLTGRWAGEKIDQLYGLDAGDILELIGWYVTEGWCNKQNGKRVGSLFIGQCRSANAEKCKRLEALFDRLGIRWAYSGPSGTSRAYTLHARSMPKALADLLRGLGDSASEKHLPDFVFDLDRPLLHRLYEGLIAGDGWRRGSAEGFYSISKILADQFQVLCQLLGGRAVIHERHHVLGGELAVNDQQSRRIEGRTAGYIVNVGSIENAKLDHAKYGVIPYGDWAFCVTVKNHAIYVRRDGIPSWTGNSNVVVKLAKIYTDQVVARIMQGIFGPEPHWIMQELNKKYAEAVKPYERYMEWSRKNMWDQRKMVHPLVQDTVKLGTGILYNDFVDEPVFRYDDKLQITIQTGTRKGPKPTWVPREDFLIPAGFHDIQVAPYIRHRVWFSWDMLERLAYQGFVENLDQLKGYADDPDEIKEARQKNGQVYTTNQSDDRFGLWAPSWVWFRRDLDRDGWPEEYVMLLHTPTKTILRMVANPSPAGIRPYCVSRFIGVEGEFDGIGIPEDIELLQEEASTIHNQRRDRGHLANIVMYIAKNVAGVTDTIRPESGKVIKTVGGADDIREFHPSTNVPIDIAEEEAVMRLAALTVGMNDVDMGKASSPVGRAAATTIMALMQEGARRFDLNVAELRAALTEQGHQITELWQIYGLPAPDQAGSPELVLDPDDATQVRALLEQPVSLRGLVSIQLNIATAAINREVEKQSNIQLYGIVAQYNQQMLQLAPVLGNPQVPQELKAAVLKTIEGQDKLLKRIFQAHNAFDLDSVLVGELFAEMAAKSMQQAQQIQQAQQMGLLPPPGMEGPPPEQPPTRQ